VTIFVERVGREFAGALFDHSFIECTDSI